LLCRAAAALPGSADTAPHEGPIPSDASIAKVKTPFLVLYGDHDHVAPYTMADQLCALGNERKRMVRFLDGGHEDLDATAGRRRR